MGMVWIILAAWSWLQSAGVHVYVLFACGDEPLSASTVQR
jgi:hypothetical protein